VLGPWVNRPWLNGLAVVILGLLFMLSAVLVVTTVFPHIDVTRLLSVLGGVLVIGLVVAIGMLVRSSRRERPAERETGRRETWTMPPLALLGRPPWSRARVLTMYLMWSYLFVAIALLIVKAFELASH
jgi:hypothetical protein